MFACRALSAELVITLLTLATSPITAQSSDASLALALDRIVADVVRDHHFMGTVMVSDGQRIRYQRTVGMANVEWRIPSTPNTRFRIASVTKQFTAMLVMQLVDAGRIRLEGTITDYLPWYPAEDGKLITVEHLLTHMSGIRDLEDVPGYYASDDSTIITHTDVVRRYLTVPSSWKPGSQFRYNNGDFIVLGAILEAVSGQPFEMLLQQRILSPLGLKNTGVVHENDIIANLANGYDRDASGVLRRRPAPVERFLASGAMYSTAADLRTWQQALLQHRLLSREATERMFRPNQWGGALGSWQYDWSAAADSVRPAASRPSLRVIERQGWIGVFRAFTAMVPTRGISVTVIANGGNTDLSTLSRGTGFVSAVMSAVERGTRR